MVLNKNIRKVNVSIVSRLQSETQFYMLFLGFYILKAAFYIKNTNFGSKRPRIWALLLQTCPVFAYLNWIFTSKTLILPRKGPKIRALVLVLEPNEKIRTVNALFCHADVFNSNDIWFSWVFT